MEAKMTEYIRKQDAVNSVECANGNITWAERDGCKKRLEELPPADVAPVVHGRWLPIVSYNNTYKCSECGRLLVDIADGLKMVAKHYPYCHCGAKMEE
jgi:DNA-directed RNA polymerase subunit RPC12/RpoP